MPEAWIIDAVRSPRGVGKKDKGALSGVHPQKILGQVLNGLRERVGFDATDVEDVVCGNGSHAGDHAHDIGRMALLDAGWPKILGKITEESGELTESLPEADRAHTAHEAADLIFHMLVGLEAAGVPVGDVFAQLRKRFGVSGIDEKASRTR